MEEKDDKGGKRGEETEVTSPLKVLAAVDTTLKGRGSDAKKGLFGTTVLSDVNSTMQSGNVVVEKGDEGKVKGFAAGEAAEKKGKWKRQQQKRGEAQVKANSVDEQSSQAGKKRNRESSSPMDIDEAKRVRMKEDGEKSLKSKFLLEAGPADRSCEQK